MDENEKVNIREFEMFLDQHRTDHERVDRHIGILHGRMWSLLLGTCAVMFTLIGYLLIHGVPWQ